MYGGATETRFANDLEDCIAWIVDRAAGALPRTVQAAQFQAERLLTLRTRNSAAYKGLYALQMNQGGWDFQTGKRIDVLAYLEHAIDIHHVFPRSWCASHTPQGKRVTDTEKPVEPGIANCIVNKTALDARTNRRIGGSAPSFYLARIEAADEIETHVLDGFLCSHDIDPAALRHDDFAQFFNQRFESLLRHAERAMCKPVNRRPDRDESPFAEQDASIGQGVQSLIEAGESAVRRVQVDGAAQPPYGGAGRGNHVGSGQVDCRLHEHAQRDAAGRGRRSRPSGRYRIRLPARQGAKTATAGSFG